ncbi:MAG: hypothetical protein LBL15_04905, partial [Oscillospiraceae bacterium]|nr:hypothetical protein [Oscillospiraceae bacterium]
MFRALLRTQLAAFGAQLFQSVANRTKKASPLKMIGLALLVLYACFAFIMMFGLYFSQLAKPLFEMGIAWLYFALFAMAASALMFTGSVFIVKSQLYEAKDNDLLLAMPIPPRLILASRMTLLLLVNFIFELLIAIPALVMWLRAAPAAAG